MSDIDQMRKDLATMAAERDSLAAALAELVEVHMRGREAMPPDDELAFNIRFNRAWAAARAALGEKA